MPGPRQQSRFVVMIFAALMGIALAVAWARGSLWSVPEVQTAAPPPAAIERSSVIEIAETRRLTLDRASLPAEGRVTIRIALPEEARGDGDRRVRIVSLDGRKLETRTRPAMDAKTGVELDVDARFLAPGRYMIEIDTTDPHALHFRRYVLELN